MFLRIVDGVVVDAAVGIGADGVDVAIGLVGVGVDGVIVDGVIVVAAVDDDGAFGVPSDRGGLENGPIRGGVTDICVTDVCVTAGATSEGPSSGPVHGSNRLTMNSLKITRYLREGMCMREGGCIRGSVDERGGGVRYLRERGGYERGGGGG